MQGIKILGTGHFVPEQVITNDDFAKIMDTSDEWISSRTGMSRRHIATDEPTWYLGARAAEIALQDAQLEPDQIDMVILSTITPDFSCPSTAAMVQKYLGIPNALTTDISVACTGIAFGIDMARRYLYTGDDVNRVLIVGADTLSQMVDYSDRSTAVLFADGAGACVVERADALYGAYQNCDASGAEHVHARHVRRGHPFGGVRDTARCDPFSTTDDGFLRMKGSDVYKFATAIMPLAAKKACEKAGVSLDEVAVIIPHQANIRIIHSAIKHLGIDQEKVFINIDRFSNTSGASIAIALDECLRSGRVNRGDIICLVGFGSGLTYGAVTFAY